MILQDAYEAAQRHLDEGTRSTHANHPRTASVEIVICAVTETDDSWVFHYQTREFLEHADIAASLIGNGPIIVPKSGDEPFAGSIL